MNIPFVLEQLQGIPYFCGMQSPELTWLTHALVNQSEVARRLGISAPLFANKVKQNQYKKFNEEELAKLRVIRQELLKELSEVNGSQADS